MLNASAAVAHTVVLQRGCGLRDNAPTAAQGVVCKYTAVGWSTPIACGIMRAWLYMLICTCIKAHLPGVLASCCNLPHIQLLTHSNLPLLGTAACMVSFIT